MSCCNQYIVVLDLHHGKDSTHYICNDLVNSICLSVSSKKRFACSIHFFFQAQLFLFVCLINICTHRERAQLKSKDETIHDLEEQIKDFKFSIKLQKSIEKKDGLKGGTLVPLPVVSDSGGKAKRSSRTSKRRN
uniref:Uncharacterized protein n=1 Tax=Arundo donax TaxID=35708 RepID=A0A0A9CQ31_ARUDO